MEKNYERLTGNQFLAKYEETHFDFCNTICDSFIKTMNELNPNRTDLVGSDWLSVFVNDYNVIINGDYIHLEPIQKNNSHF